MMVTDISSTQTKYGIHPWSWLPRPIHRSAPDYPRPIFITGIPRCGSSWVGEVLGSCSATRYVYEPFNPQWMPVLRGQFRAFRYLGEQSDAPELLKIIANAAFEGRQSWKQFARAVYRGYPTAACRTARQLVVKDPTASLAASWVASHYRAQILIVIRHPCGYASSIESLGWPLNVNVILGQKELMRKHLEPYRDTLRRARNDKWLTRGAMWGAIHTVFSHQLSKHTDWLVCQYEDLCLDPFQQFSLLAERLGLEIGRHTRRKISQLSLEGNSDPGSTRRKSVVMPEIWRQRMSPGEIDAVMAMVSEFDNGFYAR